MSDLKTITYRPGAGEYAWTFGGAAPVMRLRTPCALELYTEDCFAGRVQSADDLVSRLNITGLNPQTGPFWIEGAEPGETVSPPTCRGEGNLLRIPQEASSAVKAPALGEPAAGAPPGASQNPRGHGPPDPAARARSSTLAGAR